MDVDEEPADSPPEAHQRHHWVLGTLRRMFPEAHQKGRSMTRQVNRSCRILRISRGTGAIGKQPNPLRKL